MSIIRTLANSDALHGFALEDLTWFLLYGCGSFVWSVLRSTRRVFNQAFSMKLFSNGLCKSADSLTDAIKAPSLSPTLAELIRAEEGLHTNVNMKQLKLSRHWVLFGPVLPTATCLQHHCEALVPEELIKSSMSERMCMCVGINQRGYSPTKHNIRKQLLLLGPNTLHAGEIVSLAAICVQYGGLQSEVMHYVRHTIPVCNSSKVLQSNRQGQNTHCLMY